MKENVFHKRFKSIISIVLVCSILSFGNFSGSIIKAAELDIVPIATDDVWISGSLDASVRYHEVTLPSAGMLSFTFQSFASYGGCALYDENMAGMYGYFICNGSAANPEARTVSYNMEAGTYYIKIYKGVGSENLTGDYRLKASFAPIHNQETEPNNSFDTAMELPKDTLLNGFISEQDSVDYYKISVSSAATINIFYNFSKDKMFSIWDGNYLNLKSEGFGTRGSGVYEKHLEPGTYYIKVKKDATGEYTLKWEIKHYVQEIKLINSKLVMNKGASGNVLSQVLPLDANIKTLKWTSSNANVATVDATGNVKAKGVGSTTITAKSTDGSNITANCYIVVKPGKAKLKSIKLDSRNKRTIKLSVAKINGASGYQYMLSKNKKFKTKKTYNVKTTSISCKKLAKNKRYYVKVRAYYNDGKQKYYGEWSKVRNIRTKK